MTGTSPIAVYDTVVLPLDVIPKSHSGNSPVRASLIATRLRSSLFNCLWLMVCIGMASPRPVAAEEADENPQWRPIIPQSSAVELKEQTDRVDGSLEFTRLHLQSSAGFQTIHVVLPRPPSLAHDEFSASVSINSSQNGIQLALRLVLPGQTDPRTGKPIVTYVSGTSSKQADQWQTLSVSGTVAVIEAKIRQLRTEVSQSGINADGAYFDACVLIAEVHQGATFIDIGETKYGPVVSPQPKGNPPSTLADHAPITNRVEVRRDQIFVGGQLVFPRLMPDHGESVEFLKRVDVNGVWVGNLNAAPRMQSLVDNNILVIATPPHPQFDPADFSTPLQGLPPLEKAHPLPSIWYFGTGVGADQMSHLLAWGREVRSADRRHRRPLMADVRSSEGVASRQMDFVGISQHSVAGLRPFGEARNRSYVRQNASAQITLPWEWIQTEPAAAVTGWRSRINAEPAYIEPEQIIMQLVALLSAGSRGVAFWKTKTIESPAAREQETSRAVELANLYLNILEPLLVRGRVEGHLKVDVANSKSSNERKGTAWLNDPSAGAGSSIYTRAPSSPDAALINTPGTSLILAGFWDQASHFVPQELFAQHASVTVSATETASAWRVAATGIQGLRRQPTAGGLYLKINDFDQLAIVLVTSNQEERRKLEERIHSNSERAARLFVELAQLKYARVSQTCQEIDLLIGMDASVSQMFTRAEEAQQIARKSLGRRDFPSAEKYAQSCMRQLRKIQNRYWYKAIQSLPTPAASPHTVSFSTLPDHWKMMEVIQGGTRTENLVPSGSFDSLRLLSEGAWKPISSQGELYHASADIVTESRVANQVLRIRAWRREDGTLDPSKPSMLVRSPEIAAVRGDVYEVTGKVRLGQAVPPDLSNPFLVFDSDLGPEFAVKPALEPSWRTFRILRQASTTGPLKFWLAVNGAAEVFVDDFQVRRLAQSPPLVEPAEFGKPQAAEAPQQSPGSRVQGAGYSNPSLP